MIIIIIISQYYVQYKQKEEIKESLKRKYDKIITRVFF